MGGSDDIVGSPAPLSQKLRPALEQAILQLVVAGFERWRDRQFNRYGDTEVEFTAVLVGCMRDIRRERNLPFVPHAEYVHYSSEVLAGRATPSRAPRIDISVWWDILADDAFFTIECKRLAPGHLAREYIDEGLLRFVSGKYATTFDAAGMIGFAIADAPETLLAHVNKRVRQRPELSDADLLVTSPPIASLATVYGSRHQRPSTYKAIRITHLFLDVRDRIPHM